MTKSVNKATKSAILNENPGPKKSKEELAKEQKQKALDEDYESVQKMMELENQKETELF